MDKDQKPAKAPIEKPWCVYGLIGWWGVGKIVSEAPDKKTVTIRYSHNQFYPLEIWENSPRYVKRFATMLEAVEEFQKQRGGPLEKYLHEAKLNFPDEAA